MSSLSMYLCARDAARAIAFYKDVFGAVEIVAPWIMPDGRVGHCELKFGETQVMIADEHPAEQVQAPSTLGGTTVQLYLRVDDVGAVFQRAVAAGCKVWRPVGRGPDGETVAKVQDPFGHNWFLVSER